ncbi:unnamed protein product [Phaedon cochleariae]|uniref:MADF domain-containing protein n=1 Tax=Phaedon cochleariae TaxID=80249 RepID=A0A9P0DVX3_PHACE|nr:unnamed protein product [Phaedon cochleariae]
MEWSNEVVLEFLSLYEEESSIWNPRDPNHKNRNLIHDAWKRIEEKMSIKCSIAELKKKKETLMGTLRKLLQKVKASSKTGSGTDEVFKPEWFAFDFMHRFLQGVYLPIQTKDSEMSQDEGRTEDNDNTDGKESEEVTVTEEIANGSQLQPPKAKSAKRKIHLLPDIDKRMDEAYKVFKNVTDTQMSPPDQCSLYGDLLATKLRALDADTREMAMIEIDLLVYRLKHRHTETYQQHFGHVHLQNVPIQSTAPFPHNSSHYQQVNFEPVFQPTLSRPLSSASSQHSIRSNNFSFTTTSPSSSSLAPTSQQVQTTVLPFSSPSAVNYLEHSTTTLPSTSAATRQSFSNYFSAEVDSPGDSNADTYEDY